MKWIRRFRALRRGDDGISLVELLVAMFIVTIILVIVYGAAVVVMKTERYTGNDSQALGELRTAADRFSKELREGKRVYLGSSTTVIKFWVDSNRDNVQDAKERITWEIRDDGGGKAKLVRYTDEAPSQVVPVASLFSFNSSFQYSPVPPGTSKVTISLSVNDQAGSSGIRTVSEQVLLRNHDLR